MPMPTCPLCRPHTPSGQGERRAASRGGRVSSKWWYLAGWAAIVGMLALGSALTGVDAGEAATVHPKAGSLTGQLLVATDALRDPRFVRTVVYMVRHDAGGAMGLVVNRPIREVPLASVLERLGMDSEEITGEVRVHYGGPVEVNLGFVLHTADYATQGTRPVKDGIAITSVPEIFRAIGAGAGPRLTLFALGYAGWAPGQLEAEIAGGDWISVPADEAMVFDENYEKKWNRAMARRRIDL